jgi:putative transposase
MFIIRRDPRDISTVYFFDPELDCYFEIPYRDTSRPVLSVWELRETRARLRQQGVSKMDEDLIFQAYRKLQAIEAEAGRATRKARRSPEKAARKADVTSEADPPAADASGESIRAFEEIEMWP